MIAIMVNSLAGGGAERIALNLFEEIGRKMGKEMLFICVEKEQIYQPPPGAKVIYLTDFNKLHNPLWKMIWIFISAYRLSRIIRAHNIEHVQSHLFRANFINTAAKLFGAKHYAQVVSHIAVDFVDSPFPLRQFKQFIYRWFYKRADEVVSISKMMRKGIEDALKLTEEGINHRVVSNPHDIGMIRRLADLGTPAFTFSPEKKYIISAGRLQKHKRLEIVIKALDNIRESRPNVELLILGDGDQRDALKRLAVDLGLEEHIHFFGHLANPFPYIKRADVFVLASEREGLPNIIIESLISGTPVIASDCTTGPREILCPDTDFRKQIEKEIEIGKYGILYPVGDVELLATAILKLLDDEQLRTRYIKFGSKYIEKYGKDRIALEFIRDFYPAEQIVKNDTIETP